MAVYRWVKKNLCQLLLVACLSAAAGATPFEPNNNFGNRDYIIVLAKASTLNEVVKQTLDSTRFVTQIAEYNQIQDLTALISDGTTIRIPTPYLNQQQTGVIAFSKGDVTLTQSERVINPTPKGTRVFAGDQLKTGSDGFVSLSFKSDTVVNVQPDSHVIVANIDCANESTKCVIALRAEKGVLSSRVKPRATDKPQIQYSVETPFLSAAVRGTAFYVDVRTDAGRLGVTEGLVAAESSRTATTLPRGKGLLAKYGTRPEQVDLLPPPELWMSAGDWLSREDVIRWGKLNAAIAYQLTIGTDETLDQPVSVERVEGLSATTLMARLMTLPISQLISQPGQYYASLAGIDDKDFVGLSADTIPFIFADIDESVQPLELQVVRQGSSIDITIPDYTGDVEIFYGEDASTLTEHKVLRSTTSVLSLEIDPGKPFVVRARKLLGEYRVSRYSDLYVFDGRNE
jgi:hypothetical protein